MSSGLAGDVDRFVDEVAADLAALSGREPDAHRADAVIEASNIVAGVLDADRRFAEAELRAYLDVVGQRLDPPLVVTPQRLREGRLLEDRRAFLDAPSVLFDLLARADARDGGRRAVRYYGLALRLTHVAAALDLVPSTDELAAIDRFRTTLLQAMDGAGIPRPGATAPRTPVTDGSGAGPGDSTGTPGGGHAPGPGAATAADGDAPARPAPPELPPARPIEELLAELDALIGLDHVKAEVRRLTSLLQVQQLRVERGLPVIETSRHLVFTGNPGTGKTTVARLLAQIYRATGVVEHGHLVETDRADLVAGFVGQTALKTTQVLESALGGMLLIDEAYALARGGENDFGREAIDTIVKFMEDHRDELAIVAAGYTAEMATLIDTNPGLKSRFTRTVHFPDYTTDELVAIFHSLGERHRYTCSPTADERLRELVDAEPRTRGFGNARFVRNLFEAAVAHHAVRVAPLTDPSDEQLTTLVADDLVPVDV